MVCHPLISKNEQQSGLVSDYFHGIFYGGWFNLISCPHFLFEIGIYLSLWLIVPHGYSYSVSINANKLTANIFSTW